MILKEYNTLCEIIYKSCVLFFLASISTVHACFPHGHIKIQNNTNIPVSLTVNREKVVTLPCKKHNKKACPKKKEHRAINMKILPNQTTKALCWWEDKMKLTDLKTSFTRNTVQEDGPHIYVENYSHILFWVYGEVQHGGKQKYIRSRGCGTKNISCVVKLARKPG